MANSYKNVGNDAFGSSVQNTFQSFKKSPDVPFENTIKEDNEVTSGDENYGTFGGKGKMNFS